MSDFTSNFWNLYVIVLTVAALLFCAWMLVKLVAVKAAPGVRATPKLGERTTETTGHVWDGDLAEYNNPLPKWWLNLFWITLIFSVVYLVLYPGLGSLPGVLGWSSTGQYERERAEIDARAAPLYAKYANMDVKMIAADPEARAMGQRLFLTYCSQCHGSDARGSRGFPNLSDRDWLWGGDPDTIVATITNGRTGMMPALAAGLGDEGVTDVVAYVRSLSGLAHDPLKAQLGKPLFAQNCAACHGAEGKGNPAVGAPNLTDSIWLWGSSEATIREGVTKGRNMNLAEGTMAMPSWKSLGPEKVRLLAAYVWGLSNGAAAK
jgi:cytochrome c oxidase cbb3-type subunit 3